MTSQSNVKGDNRQIENLNQMQSSPHPKKSYFLHLQITSVAENVGVTWFKSRHQDATRKMSLINDPIFFCSNAYLQPYIIYFSKHHATATWDLGSGSNNTDLFFKHHERKNMKTLQYLLQPYISPNVFTFPSMAACVFWIYGKGKYLWQPTARLRTNEQSSILLHLDM